YASPPPAYWLWNAEAGFDLQTAGQPLSIHIAAYNLLNKTYRDYMNRFRYFSDEQGFNFVFRFRLPLQFFKHLK
ncbi:MAG: hypothetical protein RMJ53_08175, partial [Chitinophagales bacterium]|nr:hypothetical protein [Chitinophagales bacterium]